MSNYIGPFIRCKYHNVAANTTIRTCTNIHCMRHGVREYSNTSFCTACGMAVADVSRTEARPSVDFWTVFSNAGLQEDALSEYGGTNGEHWYVPNRPAKVELDRKRYADSEPGIHFTVIPEEIRLETEWIDSQYKEEISALRKAYDSVEVDWGAITHGF